MSTYDLGYDALAEATVAPAAATDTVQPKLSPCPTCDGAMSWNTNACAPNAALCHTYFVAKSFSPKLASQRDQFQSFLDTNQWEGVIQCGWNPATSRFEGSHCGLFRTGSDPTGSPAPKTVFHLMQGQWEFCVTESQYVIPGGSLPIPGKWTYSALMPVSITSASDNSCFFDSCWTNVVSTSVPGGGQWMEPAQMTACPTNNSATQPVGTGEFQATLTWVNTSTSDADVDLHLYGPSNMHVYYDNDTSADGSLKLDRDWQDELGNAVENIYSTGVSPMPNGDYRVTVLHYSGTVPMSYNVRVIRSGASTTYSGTLTSNKQEIEIMRFTR